MARGKVKWIGSEPKCDFCGNKKLTEFVDGKTDLGPWGLMCPDCNMEHGCGLGLGVGQRYKLEADGHFYKVEG